MIVALQMAIFSSLFLLIGCERKSQTSSADFDSHSVPQGVYSAPIVVLEQPVISVHLVGSFSVPAKPEGPSKFAIDIYADGRCKVYPPLEGEVKISQQNMDAMFHFFESEGVLGLTDGAIYQAMIHEVERKTGKTPGVLWAAWTHDDFTELIIRQNTNTTHLLCYSFPNQIQQFPDLKELLAVQHSLEKVYSVVGMKTK